ncbi:ribosomal protein S18-alanine N-acetyltransferase [Nostocoides sp. Soil756]|jgi:ribosomal-protein-alanine N-acetyltransferase|uniref:ribosomal protein S18-alanine N-acetyltransferase n=1 Tax=Nostocoides sp. Soil756 TaxID=1736399 RepID=UPI0006F6DB13|nr:ribosomal protein S18-alanine N-acetyltransferase [Tetrasphaera sp. Soil756]KRE62073.1 ribosomal-protein-alanine acetyltransferase [Tetrasphaera sp. Soil756]
MTLPTATAARATAGTSLRDARWGDVEALAALERDLFPDDAWSVPSWWAELAGRPRRDYVVLTDEAGIAGYGGLDHGGEVSDVMTVAVAPRRRGGGLGRLLLGELERRARHRGAAHVLLEVRADNEAALALYRRSGFVEIARRRGYYQPGAVDALVLRKTLSTNGVGDG